MNIEQHFDTRFSLHAILSDNILLKICHNLLFMTSDQFILWITESSLIHEKCCNILQIIQLLEHALLAS